MLLADEIIGAAGKKRDAIMRGAITALADRVGKAERFVLDDGVVGCVEHVKRTKPSSILDAFHLCRPPYPVTWLEYSTAGLDFESRADDVDATRPRPNRIGYLIEESDGHYLLTVAWSHAARGINIGVLSSVVSYAGDVYGHIERAVSRTLKLLPDKLKLQLAKVSHRRQPLSLSEVRAQIGGTLWGRLPEEEVQALFQLQNFEEVIQCPYTLKYYFAMADAYDRRQISHEQWKSIADGWIKDMSGEPCFARAALLIMNSRNAVAFDKGHVDKSANRNRRRLGRKPLLGHSIVRLDLSRVQQRRTEGAGEASPTRAHLVRGHFKVRRTGVFWWSAFVRGSVPGTVEHRHYDVGGLPQPMGR